MTSVHDLVDGDAEDLGDLGERQQAHVGRRGLGHAPIMAAPPRGRAGPRRAVDNDDGPLAPLSDDGAHDRSRSPPAPLAAPPGATSASSSASCSSSPRSPGSGSSSRAARQTAPVFAAAHTIVPGRDRHAPPISTSSRSRSARSAAPTSHPTRSTDGLVATRTIAAGELVPAAAVGDAARARTTSVVVRSAVDVPASVEAGTRRRGLGGAAARARRVRRAAHPRRRRHGRLGARATTP